MNDSVLVVDDDFSGRTMLAISLRQAGFSAQAVPNGAEALNLLKTGRYDWLVTDARMSPMSGFDLSKRAKEFQPDLRIIMISAIYADKDTDGYPIEKFFSKPVPVENLVYWMSIPSHY